jgi:hypothetical protein
VLRDADELVAPTVEATLGKLRLDDTDAAVVQLARRYAATIDAAATLATYAATILETLDPGDVAGRQHLAALAAKVGRQAVLNDLGPKLLSALKELHATPAARARRKGGGGGDRAEPSRLQALRQARR